MGDLYQQIKNSGFRRRTKEDKDCSVISVAIACSVSYAEAHAWMSYAGRQDQQTVSVSKVGSALKNNGFSFDRVKPDRQSSGSKYTPKTIGKRVPEGRHIVCTKTHMFPVIEGEVEDWSENRKYYIEDIYKVEKKK